MTYPFICNQVYIHVDPVKYLDNLTAAWKTIHSHIYSANDDRFEIIAEMSYDSEKRLVNSIYMHIHVRNIHKI